MEKLEKQINQIVNLFKKKKILEAESQAKKILSLNPGIAFLYNLLGLIKFEQKNEDDALNYYNMGLKIKPDYAMIYNNLGTLYKSKKNYSKAEEFFQKALSLDNKISEPENNLGNLYIELNEYKKAIVCFNKSIKKNPNSYIAYYNLGISYKSLGEFEQSSDYLKKSIELFPYFYKAHRALSQIIKYKLGNEHLNILKELYLKQNINDEDKSEISFALGKAFEDMKDYKNSYKYYDEGNRLRRKCITFSIEDAKRDFSNIKSVFNKNFIKKYTQEGSSDDAPIFIVGMPRSGTTLVEQIISSHPKVFGGGELDFFDELIHYHFCKNNRFSKKISKLDIKQNLENIRKSYIKKIKKISPIKTKITDKLPINFKWIGFIKLIFPKAKVIHCVRSPHDTCLSIYKNYFTNINLNYAYNLRELVKFYNLYYNLMNFWKKNLPNFIFDIKYEKLVNDPKKQIKNLIKYSDLTWDEKCLRFYENKRAITTASDIQARSKIYKDSVSSWKFYEIFLKQYFSKLNF